jgi:hypothetical protein
MVMFRNKFFDILKRVRFYLSEKQFNALNYWYLHWKLSVRSKPINWISPSSFNQKIIWLKMNYRHPNAWQYADKVTVKRLVGEAIGPEFLIPTLNVFASADDVEISSMPDRFILKASHGSGWNIIVVDKDKIDLCASRHLLGKWLQTNYYRLGREYQYNDIPRRILVEPLLEPNNNQPLLDYKFFCFHGEPRFVQVDFDRHTFHTRNFYDLCWNKLPFTMLYPAHEGDALMPKQLQKMVDIARKLSIGFPFIRVDLYDCDGVIYFGELTFHPGGGFEPILPDCWDKTLGDWLELPKV